MIQAITLSIEQADDLVMQCSACKQPIISLHQAIGFLKVSQASAKYYFAVELCPQPKHQQYIIDEYSSYIEVAEAFFLMELMPVRCSECQFQVGIFVNRAAEQESLWLAKSVLFDSDRLQFTPKELKSQLINQLQTEIEESNDSNMSFSKLSRVTKPKLKAGSQGLVFSEIIKEALENITFYSQLLDDLNKRFDNYIAIRRFQIAKRHSEMKAKAKPNT